MICQTKYKITSRHSIPKLKYMLSISKRSPATTRTVQVQAHIREKLNYFLANAMVLK